MEMISTKEGKLQHATPRWKLPNSTIESNALRNVVSALMLSCKNVFEFLPDSARRLICLSKNIGKLPIMKLRISPTDHRLSTHARGFADTPQLAEMSAVNTQRMAVFHPTAPKLQNGTGSAPNRALKALETLGPRHYTSAGAWSGGQFAGKDRFAGW